MSQIKRKIYKLRLNDLKNKNKISNSIHHWDKEIKIVSAPKYVNKIKEDLRLQECFLKNKINCQIISYQDHVKDEKCLVRSVWGYHNNYEEFISFVNRNQTFNSNSIILHNMDKKKQYELLTKYSIPRIETKFVDSTDELEINGVQVVKPVVSASGDHTYIIKDEDDLDQIGYLENIMVQPFIENIKNGEISVIVIGKEIQYGIIRHPGVFTEYEKEIYIPKEELDPELIKLVHKILEIKEYQDAVFMRVDCVKDDEYKVMELELVDPDLFIESIPNKELRQNIYQKLVDIIKDKI